MPVLVELSAALLRGFLAAELDATSRRALRTSGGVTDQAVLPDLSLGLTAVLATGVANGAALLSLPAE